ncbi:hypothetical protein [Hyalangium gracile]|uniref:hypothetical protein n=1 Tax=Hyalangium gracile TaxID=394092 RepID=UPI001CCB8C07|nr:hypothetical protein [Hyalangium gracile]
MGKVLKGIGKVASTVGKIAGKVANIGGKVLNIINKPMEALTSPIKKLAGGVLDKLPFGLGKMIKPFADKFIDGAASFLSGNVLGGLGVLGKAAKTVGDVVNIAEKVKGVADKVGAFSNDAATGNWQNIIARTQAQFVE